MEARGAVQRQPGEAGMAWQRAELPPPRPPSKQTSPGCHCAQAHVNRLLV